MKAHIAHILSSVRLDFLSGVAHENSEWNQYHHDTRGYFAVIAGYISCLADKSLEVACLVRDGGEGSDFPWSFLGLRQGFPAGR